MSHAEFIRNFYSQRLAAAENRAHYDILDWASAAAQQARFQVLAEHLTAAFAAAPSLLDVGCGFADLAADLAARRLPARYAGVDLNAELLAAARAENPLLDLRCGDIFTDERLFAPQEFDVVFASGVFNLRLDNNAEFARNAVRRLQRFAKHSVVVNFLHRRAAAKYDECFYYSPPAMLAETQSPDWEITLRDDYLENDFTLIFRRREH
ncbi:MAG: class I SAM-dependent methyltransferase [Planctomycetota bacterium]|jgi:SAM-dependent methyltransferase|nr:class I SAM-dependent methyltransferase [Planctomycetota bacterium]